MWGLKNVEKEYEVDSFRGHFYLSHRQLCR